MQLNLSKEELVKRLEQAVGNTPYGKMLVEEAAATYEDAQKKYGQNMIDRLHERIGVLKAYERIHREEGQDVKAIAEKDKIEIAQKALEAIS